MGRGVGEGWMDEWADGWVRGQVGGGWQAWTRGERMNEQMAGEWTGQQRERNTGWFLLSKKEEGGSKEQQSSLKHLFFPGNSFYL